MHIRRIRSVDYLSNRIWDLRNFSVFLLSLFLCSSCNIALIISHVKHRVLIILWKICERYEPCTFTWKSHLSSLLDKDGSFMKMYRATARQRGKSFPSCAWRLPLLHRDFSLAFALNFLGLTTFLRQIRGKFKNASAFLLRGARHAIAWHTSTAHLCKSTL